MKKQPVITEKMYIVRYYGGGYDDHCTVDIFVTSNKLVAKKYATRFNKMIKKWKEYYSQLEYNKYGILKWILDEDQSKYKRWHSLRNISRCFWEEIEVR